MEPEQASYSPLGVRLFTYTLALYDRAIHGLKGRRVTQLFRT